MCRLVACPMGEGLKSLEKARVFVTRLIPAEGLKRIKDISQTEVWPGEVPPSHDRLLDRVPGINGLVCLLTDPIDEAVMEAAGDSLKVISQMAVGVDNIDLEAATSRGIPVGHTPGVLTETTADFAFALLMAAARRLVEGVEYVRAGRWVTWGPTLLMGMDIHGATLGIVGLGRIGKAVARRARGFEMKVIYHDPSADSEAARELEAEARTLEELLEESDFVSLHVPLTEETEHLIDTPALERMKPSSILVNTSRGQVVNSEALHQALVAGKIAYAALDVTNPEPIPPEHPLL